VGEAPQSTATLIRLLLPSSACSEYEEPLLSAMSGRSWREPTGERWGVASRLERPAPPLDDKINYRRRDRGLAGQSCAMLNRVQWLVFRRSDFQATLDESFRLLFRFFDGCSYFIQVFEKQLRTLRTHVRVIS